MPRTIGETAKRTATTDSSHAPNTIADPSTFGLSTSPVKIDSRGPSGGSMCRSKSAKMMANGKARTQRRSPPTRHPTS